MLVIVDGMNVLASRPDGWWRDRTAAMQRFAARVDRLAARDDDDWIIVFDGRERPLRGIKHAEVVWAARRGPDAADDRIVDLLRESAGNPGSVVYTSDRELGRRAAALGAEVRRAGELLRRLELLGS